MADILHRFATDFDDGYDGFFGLAVEGQSPHARAAARHAVNLGMTPPPSPRSTTASEVSSLLLQKAGNGAVNEGVPWSRSHPGVNDRTGSIAAWLWSRTWWGKLRSAAAVPGIAKAALLQDALLNGDIIDDDDGEEIFEPAEGAGATGKLRAAAEAAERNRVAEKARVARTRTGWVAGLVADLKAENGRWRREPANEATIRRKLYVAMKARGMRKAHIAEQMEFAVNAFFMLSTVQRQALALTASLAQKEDLEIQKVGYVAGPVWDRRYTLPFKPLQ